MDHTPPSQDFGSDRAGMRHSDFRRLRAKNAPMQANRIPGGPPAAKSMRHAQPDNTTTQENLLA